jgi:hypothetical protein
VFTRAELAANPIHQLVLLVLSLVIIIVNCSVRCLLAKIFGAPSTDVLSVVATVSVALDFCRRHACRYRFGHEIFSQMAKVYGKLSQRL